MPKASRTTASESVEVEGYEGHFEHFDGGYTVAFETYTQDADLSAVLRRPAGRPLPVRALGLRHQGQGDLQDRRRRRDLRDRRRLLRAAGPHARCCSPGTEVVEFSPTHELERTMEVVTRNMEAA